jgi:hypothetical protein
MLNSGGTVMYLGITSVNSRYEPLADPGDKPSNREFFDP